MKKLLFSVFLLLSSISADVYSNYERIKPFSWSISTGAEIRYLSFIKDLQGNPTGTEFTSLQGSPLLQFGLNWRQDYGAWSFHEELTWLAYKDLFSNDPIYIHPIFGRHTIPAWTLLFVPVPDLMVGYTNQLGGTFKIGLTYLWGVCSAYEHPIDENQSITIKHRWFFDRFTYYDGIHDMHFLIGFEKKF